MPAGAAAAGLADPGPVETRAIDTSPGVQTDPHIDGDLVSYANEDPSTEIREFDLATGANTALAQAPGDFDFLSDTNAGRTTWTRVNPNRSAIMLNRPGGAVEVDPQTGSRRRGSALGGETVAWQDFGFGTPAGSSEVAAHDLASGTVTRLTDDALLDKNVAVSPDGKTLTWIKCQVTATDCDVWAARRSASGWSASRLTGAEGEEAFPDTDGTSVVYQSTRGGESDVYAQPVAGGAERRLDLPGTQGNANISRGVVSLETFEEAAATPNWDLVAWDLASDKAYRLTDTASGDDTLNDISVDADGLVRVPYSVNDNIELVSFTLPNTRDTRAPAISLTTPAEGATFTLGQSVAADYRCDDGEDGSGISSCTGDVPSGRPIDTSSVGPKSFTVTTEDNAGNRDSVTHGYSVEYAFGGFKSPLNAPPVVNLAKAGSAVPVKFSLAGDQGLGVLADGYPRSQQVPCDSSAPVDGIEETQTTGQTGLTYSADADQYSYIWKTARDWGGTCRQLALKLDDGTVHRASFRFR